MAKRSPQLPLPDDPQERLKFVALNLFAEKGFEGTSTRDIAEAAKLNVSLISYYFGGKRELYLQILQDGIHRARSQVVQLASFFPSENMTPETFEAFFRKFIFILIQEKSQNTLIERIMSREIAAGLPNARDLFNSAMSDVGDFVVSILQEAQKKGIIKAHIPMRLFLLNIVHSVEGYLNSMRCDTKWLKSLYQIPQHHQKLADHFYEIFIHGASKLESSVQNE